MATPGLTASTRRRLWRLRATGLAAATLLVAVVPSLRAGDVVAPWRLATTPPQADVR